MAPHTFHIRHDREHRGKAKHLKTDCPWDRVRELAHIGPGDTAWENGAPIPIEDGCGWQCPDCFWECGEGYKYPKVVA